MSIDIDLPSLGCVEVGLSACINSSLPEDEKLPIVVVGKDPAPIGLVKQSAVVWAYSQFTDITAKTLLCNGVLGIIDAGLICKFCGSPDGDWKEQASPIRPTDVQQKVAIENIVSDDGMKKAVTVAIATKVNYWQMNHHTGRDGVAGYVKEVLEAFYPDAVTDQVVLAAHNLGRFCSTLRVLELADVQGLQTPQDYIQQKGTQIVLSRESKERFQSMPAGTQKLAVAYEAARRLVRSVYAAYCPGVEEFERLPALRAAVLQNPARYHVDAAYLTEYSVRVENYRDADMNAYLGRLGTFITTLYKQSGLAKSPYLTTARVESYDDYNPSFKATLVRIQVSIRIQAATKGRIAKEQFQQFETVTEDELQRLRHLYRTN